MIRVKNGFCALSKVCEALKNARTRDFFLSQSATLCVVS